MSEETTETTATAETTTEAPAWHEGVEGITDKDMESKSLSDYVQSTQNLRTLATSKGIPVPGEGATDDQHAAFRTSVEEVLGADAFRQSLPSVDKYEVPALAATESLSDERRTGIIQAFHDAGINADQSQKVMEMFGAEMELDRAEFKTVIAQRAADTTASLKQEWGDGYQTRIAAVNSVKEDNTELVAVLAEAGLDNDQRVIGLLDMFARATGESKLAGNSEARAGAKTAYDEYVESAEYKEVLNPNSSLTLEEHSRRVTKARELLRKM